MDVQYITEDQFLQSTLDSYVLEEFETQELTEPESYAEKEAEQWIH